MTATLRVDAPTHPAGVDLASVQELAARSQTAHGVFGEVSGVWLPRRKAERLVASLDAAQSADDMSRALIDADLMFVSLTSLRRFGVADPPVVLSTLAARADLLAETLVEGVFEHLPVEYVRADWLLSAMMHVNPGTRASLGPLALCEQMMWVKRTHGFGLNVPANEPLLACLPRESVTDFEPRSPFWLVDSVPVFSPVTELAYVAAHPDDRAYPLSDVPDFVDALSWRVTEHTVCHELTGRPAAVWLRMACLLARGGRPEVVGTLASSARGLCGAPRASSIERERHRLMRRSVVAWRPHPVREIVADTLALASAPCGDDLSLLAALAEQVRVARYEWTTLGLSDERRAELELETHLRLTGQENTLLLPREQRAALAPPDIRASGDGPSTRPSAHIHERRRPVQPRRSLLCGNCRWDVCAKGTVGSRRSVVV